ncbi:MAG: ATP-binding protein, partial [Deltaproteobacteria bacterium]|nr:ATP-binding protein [Deltaproteobacteria bacterium]
EEMPLSFAINYLNKYSYHRFPVLNKDSHLIGIITGRDNLVVLLRELNKEVQELEKKVNIESEKKPGQERNEFVVQQFDFENAGKASFAIKKALQAKGIPAGTIRRVAVAAYELEINIAIHSHGGKILFTLDEGSVTIVAKDNGPGIEDVERALGEGFSTANDWIRSLGFGAGMGLPNTKRVSDEFKISSNLGEGTVVISTVYLEKYGA